MYIEIYLGYILGCIVITAQLKLKLKLTEQFVT